MVSRDVRWVGWVLLTIVVAGYLAAEMPLAAAPPPAPHGDLWRRTRDGWQHATWLLPDESIPSRRPALHPVVVGLLEILLSAAALVAFADGGPAGPHRRVPGSKQPLPHGPAWHWKQTCRRY